MKTAISIPDAVFEKADSLARRLHVSRSRLYVMAIELMIREHEKDDLTERIDAYIEEHGQPVDRGFLDGALRDMRDVEW